MIEPSLLIFGTPCFTAEKGPRILLEMIFMASAVSKFESGRK